MEIADDGNLRVSAQRALLTHITPRLRAVSLDIHVDLHRVCVRVIFDGEPNGFERDAVSCAATEIIADYTDGWDVTEEIAVCPAPNKMEHLRLLVYHRCEDSWVTGETPGTRE